MARTRTPDEEKVAELQNLAKVLGFKISNVKIQSTLIPKLKQHYT